MIEVNKETRYRIAPLFDRWEETLICSCLQGYMGNAWTDDLLNPHSAQIITGDFCFFAGIPDKELVRNIPDYYPSSCILMVPRHSGWATIIEQQYEDTYERFMRYAIKKEPEVFDTELLRFFADSLPSEYDMKLIQEELYQRIRLENWSKDLCSQFPTYKDYETYGLGFVILYKGEPVSGASSYTVYDKGIEVEIDTKEEFRRSGLAVACASRLLLECLNRNLYPSWDAANKSSLALAEKLGYHFDKEYVTYAVTKLR